MLTFLSKRLTGLIAPFKDVQPAESLSQLPSLILQECSNSPEGCSRAHEGYCTWGDRSVGIFSGRAGSPAMQCPGSCPRQSC